MPFHPQMNAKIHGLKQVSEHQSMTLDGLIVDSWHMESDEDAGGRYVSEYPRFVFFYEKQKMSLVNPSLNLKNTAACFFVPPKIELEGRIKRSGEVRHVDIHMDEATLQRLVANEYDTSSLVTLYEQKQLEPLLNVIVDECIRRNRPDFHMLSVINSLILELLHFGTVVKPNATSELMQKLEKFVAGNFEEKITTDDLAKLIGMSRRDFNHWFKVENNQTPHNWLTQRRIDYTQTLLLEGQSFAEVAFLAGFTDQSHFNRVFKKCVGITPSDWINRTQSSRT